MNRFSIFVLFSRSGIQVCFLVIALPSSMLLAFLTPPFQNPDEIAHVLRADQVARGGWRGERVDCASAADPVLCRISDEVAFGLVGNQPTLGGKVDLGLLRLASIYRALPFNPDRTATRTMNEAARVIGFAQVPHLAAFTNTAAYSPLFYLPPAAAIGVARSLGLTPLVALRLARIVNLLVTLGVATLALRLCLRGARSMAVLLILPMSLALSASVAPDGMMFAAAALGAAILSRAMQRQSGLSWCDIGVLAAILLALSLPRPPYVVLGLLVLTAPVATPVGSAASWRSLLLRFAVMLPAGLGVVGWIAAVSSVIIPVPVAHDGLRPDMAGQLAFLLADPLRLTSVLQQTLARQAYTLGYQAIGVLGWLDTPLPRTVYVATIAALALALAADMGAEDRRPGPSATVFALGLGTLGIVAVGLSLALYVSYSPPGYPVVVGLQGRYFLPPLLMIVPFLPRMLPPISGSGLAAAGGFLILSLIVVVLVPVTIVARFALGL